jgi:hypothetical protein
MTFYDSSSLTLTIMPTLYSLSFLSPGLPKPNMPELFFDSSPLIYRGEFKERCPLNEKAPMPSIGTAAITLRPIIFTSSARASSFTKS